jgi:hypothetical protein
MSIYFYYVNDSRKEYFCIDPTGSQIKYSALGRNIGSRALSYLILENDPEYTGVEPHPLVGRWIGDRFFVTGDDYSPDFERIEADYTDIGQAVIEMLVQIRPYELLMYGGVEWLLSLIDGADGRVTVTGEMRKRLSQAFRHELHMNPDADLEKIVSALRMRQ